MYAVNFQKVRQNILQCFAIVDADIEAARRWCVILDANRNSLKSFFQFLPSAQMGTYLSVELNTTSDYIQLGIVAVLLLIITYLLKKIFSPPKPIIIKNVIILFKFSSPKKAFPQHNRQVPVRPPLEKKGWTKAELRAYNGTDPEKHLLVRIFEKGMNC